ncbi:MAG: OB-fold domain-containing protein, partial [Eikenella corrodens]
MISKLTGKLIEAIPPQVVIDINGVAYEADVSMQTFYTLPPVGETVSLYTQLIVREDAHLLFGFGSHSERNTFRQL